MEKETIEPKDSIFAEVANPQMKIKEDANTNDNNEFIFKKRNRKKLMIHKRGGNLIINSMKNSIGKDLQNQMESWETGQNWKLNYHSRNKIFFPRKTDTCLIPKPNSKIKQKEEANLLKTEEIGKKKNRGFQTGKCFTQEGKRNEKFEMHAPADPVTCTFN